MKLFPRVITALLFFLFNLYGVVFAATLHIKWCPVSNAVGYKVYHGTEPGIYNYSWDNGDYTVYDGDLLAEGVYFVAVSAYGDDLSEVLSEEKIVVLVENGEDVFGWSVLKGVIPVAGVDLYNALFFSGKTNSTAIGSNKISLANVPAVAKYLSLSFKATGSGGYFAISMTTKSKGTVTLSYKLLDANVFGATTATFGLGTALKDGEWHTVERDLADDLVTAGIAPADDIKNFNLLYVYSYYNNSVKIRTVGFSQNPNSTVCP